MAWLWKGIEGPHPIPDWAYSYLVTILEVNPGLLLCVEQINFEGDVLLKLIRVFDPLAVPEGSKIEDFTSLDQHPELILYEGYRDEESGKVQINIHKRPAVM